MTRKFRGFCFFCLGAEARSEREEVGRRQRARQRWQREKRERSRDEAGGSNRETVEGLWRDCGETEVTAVGRRRKKNILGNGEKKAVSFLLRGCFGCGRASEEEERELTFNCFCC